MMVVLGAVVLFTLLGYVALTLARQDNSVAGSLVDIKSQELSAAAGLNLSLARLQEDPSATLEALNDFLEDPSKAYLDFEASGKPIAVSGSETWHPLAGSGKEEVQVRILGISEGSTSGSSGGTGIRIALASRGKGRDGNVHEITAIYNLRGIDFVVAASSSAPNYAFLVQGELGQFHCGNVIDGSVYSGSPTGTTVIENNASQISKLKVAGNVTTHQTMRVLQPSVIGGRLFLDDAHTLTFDSSLIVLGGMFVSGTVAVNGSLYVSGGTQSYLNIGKLQVQDVLWIQDRPLTMSAGAGITVGNPASNKGLAILDAGAHFANGFTSNVHGSMYVGDSMTVAQTLNVAGNLEFRGTALIPIGGQLNVTGNAALGGEPFVYWNAQMNIGGSSVLKNGVTGYRPTPWGLAAGDGILTFTGSTWMHRAVQDRTYSGLALRFGSSLSLNGGLTGNFRSNTNWSFLNAATTPATWSANVSGLTLPQQPDISTVLLSKGFTTRTSDEPEPSLMPNRFSLSLPTTTALNYSASDLALSRTDPSNAPSTFSLTSNPAFVTVRDASKWETIKAEYSSGTKKNWCSDAAVVPGGNAALGSYGTFPSAAMLNCIYGKEKNLGAASTHLWNQEYLVIWLPPTWADGNNRWVYTNTLAYTADQKVGSLETGVKIIFIVQQPGGTTSWEWYNNKAGSVQILYSEGDMTNFCWSGDFYGYIYFNYTGAGTQQMFNGNKGMNLIGAWENTNPNIKVWFTATSTGPNSSLSITNQSTAAKNVFTDIVANFRASAVTGSNPIIVFNSDKGTGSSSGTRTLTHKDGWIQMERIGEFR